MKIIKTERKLCLSCMEEHNVSIVEVEEQVTFKGFNVDFVAIYEYCADSDELTETEEMISSNNLAVKDAYRSKVGLLTSIEIKNIREKYGISQKDFSQILDWGMATITRYENHQVQDRAHDDILRKIDSDPKWFLDMIKRSKERLSEKAFSKYFREANYQYNKSKNKYLVDLIYAIYANYSDEMFTGKTELDLRKVIEVINYLAMNVSSLHKVKLMKMLWYSDILNFKRYGKSITGLAYSALPMGAVPEGREHIVLLDGVSFDTVFYGENEGFKFKPTPGIEFKAISDDKEFSTIDKVISELGNLTTNEIVDRMHKEDAYKYTPSYGLISYSFADQLSIE